MATNWFEVDKAGLAKLRENCPKSALVFELVQNAWDTGATKCEIMLQRCDNKSFVLSVEDDNPTGFSNLTHAYTLFAESEKKTDHTKRGRFNLGEKLVLALCDKATISSTTGTVTFDSTGRRVTKVAREVGSKFVGVLSLTKEEFQEIEFSLLRLLPPTTCITTYNGHQIPPREPLAITKKSYLPTVVAKSNGSLQVTNHVTTVHIHEPQIDEEPMIYELGIPVMESGDKYHYDVQQKVPLTLDRESVTPAFLRKVRALVAETMLDQITQEDANQTWVREAASAPDASKELVTKVIEQRFGDKVVTYDSSDKEANLRAVEAGYTLVTGSQLSKEEWANVREHQVFKPAGQVFKNHKIELSSEGREFQQANITPEMRYIKALAVGIADSVLGVSIAVEFINEFGLGVAACYGQRTLRFNVAKLGKKFFENGASEEVLDLIIHELAHEWASNHLSTEYYNACTKIGARTVRYALANPEFFE